MEPQKKIKTILTYVGICAAPDGVALHVKYRQKLVAIAIMLFCFAPTLSFTIGTILADDFETSFNSACDAINYFYITVVTFINFLYREEIKQVFAKIQQNANHFQDDDSAKFIVEADRKGHKVAKVLIDYLISGLSVVYVLIGSITLAVNIYQDGYIDNNRLFMPYIMHIPWSTSNTFFGWFAYFFIFYFFLIEWYLIQFVNILLTLAICLSFPVFCKQFQSILTKLHAASDTMQREDPNFVRRTLSDLIEQHMFMKEFFVESAAVLRNFIFLFLLNNLCTMTIKLFLIYQFTEHLNVIYVIDLFLAFINVYVYCALGDLVTSNCLKLVDDLYESKWYNLPTKYQNYYILMIANVQRPIAFDGFYVVLLNWETFSKLMKSFVSYFMLLGTLNAE